MRFHRNQRKTVLRAISNSSAGSNWRRRSTLEMLEGRAMLSTSPWQNPYNPKDVNHDARVSPIDALVVINDLARNGSHALGGASAVPLTAGGTSSSNFLDVNGDNKVSPIDALRVINLLATPKQMEIHTFATDMAGNPITSINAGSDFKIQTVVTDIRDPVSQFAGVFASYVNVSYDPALSTVANNATISYDPFFSIVRTGDTSTPGFLSDVGASTQSGSAPGNAPQPIWSVVSHAVAGGTQQFNLSFDTVAGHDNLVYLNDDPLTEDQISFVGGTLTINAQPTITVSDVSKAEGTSATPTPFVFTVSLSNTFAQPVTVAFQTVAGTATAGVDYTPTSGTLTFNTPNTTQLVTVLVAADSTVESNETFNLVLSSPTNASLGNSSAQATIVDDDVLGGLSIADAQVTNVTTGTTNMVFTVSLASASAQPVTVQFGTADGTALDGVDYTTTSGILTFNPGTLQQFITVSILGDPNPDEIETFQVNLTNPSNAALTDGTATGTIFPAVGIPALQIGNVSKAEGDLGTLTAFVFTVKLSNESSQTIQVAFNTADGTAIAANPSLDYIPTAGVLTFAPLETQKLITVQVIGDANVESDETFNVVLTPVSGPVAPGTVTAVGTILNDDGTPSISIADTTVGVGSSGTVNAIFTVTLSAPITSQVTLGYATADGTATAGLDYIPQTGNLTFTPGGTQTQLITVPVIGSSVAGPDENFFVNLSSLTGDAQFSKPSAQGVIVRQGLVIANESVIEDKGDPNSPGNALFTVTLTRTVNQTVTVAFTTEKGTDPDPAIPGEDFTATSGTLTFAPNQSTAVITVPITADTTQEANENFLVKLSGASGSVIIVNTGVGTIINDDGVQAAVTMQLANTSGVALAPGTVLNQGDNFLLQVFVQDTETNPTGILQAYVDALYNSTLVSAVPGTLTIGDAFPSLRSGSIPTAGHIVDAGGVAGLSPPADPGDKELLFSIQLHADNVGLATFSTAPTSNVNQGHDIFVFGNNNPVTANYQEDLSINIGHNVFAVDNVSQLEGNSGQTAFVFTVTRFLPTQVQATVPFFTANGTATVGEDYVASSGTLTFAVGETTKQVTIFVNGDTKDENDETFQLKLGPATGATSSQSPGIGTIVNDDTSPAVNVGNASASEGQNLAFTVTLGAVSGKTVTVQFATADGTATAGADYTATSGVVTFLPGVTQQVVTVHALTDILLEPTETFQLVLSNPVNATLGTSQGTGSIIDIPPASISGSVFVDLNKDGVKENNETGIPDVAIIVTPLGGGASQTVLTKADGSFTAVGLAPGTYTIKEVQPGFFVDGRDTRFGVDSPVNDTFSGITLAPSQAVGGFNFAEMGMRADFASMFLNRRALFGSAVTTGEIGSGTIGTPGDVLNLQTGDVWLSFDGGWQGARTIQAFYNASQGNVTMTLYDNNLKTLTTGVSTATGAQLQWTGTFGPAYFLKIAGTNPHVTLQFTGGLSASGLSLVAPSGSGSSSSDSSGSSSTGSATSTAPPAASSSSAVSPTTLFASASSSSSDDDSAQATDEALSEDEDWFADLLMA